MLNHVWQSTVFAGLAWMLTLVLKKDRAQVRYAVWLAASTKFLVPFAVLVDAGSHVSWRRETAVTGSTVLVAPWEQPPKDTVAVVASESGRVDLMPELLWLVWGCGFMATLILGGRKWTRMHVNVRAARPVDLGLANPVRESAELFEPGVFGVFRPVLLLPEGIIEKLTAAQLQAILAHELCHVRRRDNLATAMRMLVEAIFWFHPLVWWMGARLVEERERACDEEVLSKGSDPRTYAEGILKVCEFYLKSPLEFVAGVAGGNLNRRIEEIMTNKIKPGLSAGRKLLLAGAGALAVMGPLGIGLLNAPPIRAQAQGSKNVAFEVASVRPAAPEPPRPSLPNGRSGGGGALPPCRTSFTMDAGRVDIGCYSPAHLIEFAHGVPRDRITGPDWIMDQPWSNPQFDIAAKLPAGASRDQVSAMVQNLLEERFKLALHRGSVEQPGFALVVDKSGLKATPSTAGEPDLDAPLCPPDATGCATRIVSRGGIPTSSAQYADPAGGGSVIVTRNARIGTVRQISGPKGSRIEAQKTTFQGLAGWLSPIFGTVVDMTGLQGRYDVVLEIRSFGGELLELARAAGAKAQAEGTLTAQSEAEVELIQKVNREALLKAGLRLEPRKVPVETLVVDHVEKAPAEN